MPASTVSARPLISRLHPAAFRWSIARALLALIALGLATLSAQADTLTLASSYKAAGKNPDGSAYTGTVTLKVISDTTYTIEWKIGDSVLKGFGMRQGDTLAATYMLDGQPGLVMYKVQQGGTLSGTWAIKGESGSGSEVLTPR